MITTQRSLGPVYTPSLSIAFIFKAASIPMYFLVQVGTHCADSEPRRGCARATPNVTGHRGVGTQLFRPFFHPLEELGEVAPVGTDLVQILLVCIGASAHLTFGRGLQALDHFHVFIIDD
jgi:hypothetical protein